MFFFQALGNLYFIHKNLMNVRVWNFFTHSWEKAEGKHIYTGNIETISTKEKSKFPQNFFPEVIFNNFSTYEYKYYWPAQNGLNWHSIKCLDNQKKKQRTANKVMNVQVKNKKNTTWYITLLWTLNNKKTLCFKITLQESKNHYIFIRQLKRSHLN